MSKNKCVEQEGEQPPHRGAENARLGVDEVHRPPAEHDAGGDGGQDARRVYRLGRQIRRKRSQQEDHARNRRIVEAAPRDVAQNALEYECRGDSDQHSAHRDDDESRAGAGERKCAGYRCCQSKAIQHQRSGVVEQTFAGDDRGDARRNRQVLEDRFGGNGIGWRNDRSQRKGQRPSEARNGCVHEDRDRDGRDDDQPDREQPDRPHVAPQQHQVGRPRCAVEQRRQYQQQDQFWLQVWARQVVRKRDADPADHHCDRIRNPKALGQDGQHDHRREKGNQNQSFVHR